MGKFSFRIPDDLPTDWSSALDGAWLANAYDHWPVPFASSRSGVHLTFERRERESAILVLALPTSHGARAIATSTLMPNGDSYQLLPELARGLLNRIRNVVSGFASAGLTLPSDLDRTARRLSSDFGSLVTAPASAEKDALGVRAIRDAIGLTDLLGDHLAELRLKSRRESQGPLPLRFGCLVNRPLTERETALYCDAFNAVQIAPKWSAIEPNESEFGWSSVDPILEWAASTNLAVSIGPIINFSGNSLPGWIRNGPSDVPSLAALMTDYVGAIVDRYRNSVRSWQIVSGLNCREAFGLDDEERLRLASRLLEFARAIDPQANCNYALEQPYGEYLRDDARNYSPVAFADTLLRNGHGDARITLSLDESRPFGCFEFWRLLDGFESLNSQLEIELGGLMDQADHSLELALVKGAMSTRSVGAIFWQNWSSERADRGKQYSALYDTRKNEPTPLLGEFRSLRQRLLG